MNRDICPSWPITAETVTLFDASLWVEVLETPLGRAGVEGGGGGTPGGTVGADEAGVAGEAEDGAGHKGAAFIFTSGSNQRSL